MYENITGLAFLTCCVGTAGSRGTSKVAKLAGFLASDNVASAFDEAAVLKAELPKMSPLEAAS